MRSLARPRSRALFNRLQLRKRFTIRISLSINLSTHTMRSALHGTTLVEPFSKSLMSRKRERKKENSRIRLDAVEVKGLRSHTRQITQATTQQTKPSPKHRTLNARGHVLSASNKTTRLCSVIGASVCLYSASSPRNPV